jgi:hypothetical protein
MESLEPKPLEHSPPTFPLELLYWFTLICHNVRPVSLITHLGPRPEMSNRTRPPTNCPRMKTATSTGKLKGFQCITEKIASAMTRGTGSSAARNQRGENFFMLARQ